MMYSQLIAQELSVANKQVDATIKLLEEGGTVPFIARYRKELTGSLDEVQIAAVRDRLQQLKELDKRRDAILKSIEEQDKLTDELESKIKSAETMSVLEDIYLPYKPKRKTKASMAREKGLEPLATCILEQSSLDVEAEASKYINEEKGVANADEALKGARDIIAETVNENAEAREKMRKYFQQHATIKSKVYTGKEEEGQKYKDYFEWEEALKDAPSHRVLAMRRGESELFLMLDVLPPEEEAIGILERQFITANNAAAEQVKLAIRDAYKRLLSTSMETEMRMLSKKKADEEAIDVFAKNLHKLLMAAPLGSKRVLAIDPGFRTGCKVVCLDAQGKLLQFEAIFPNEPQKKVAESGAVIKHLVDKHNIEAIAIGNGTASRETEDFVRNLGLPSSVTIVMVNESGASIYSASEIARNEFPDQDVTVRGAVSIGRRLMDPLAELVKIDPKSIGVGQYQHDVDQSALKHSLDDVVMSCVNAVGVEVNTASEQLLTYVAGLGPQLAKNIVEYRNQNGPFTNRAAIKNVQRLGEKAFEQAAGFLRIKGAANPLDDSAVHPEAYSLVKKMAKDLNCEVKDLIRDASLRAKIDLKQYVTDTIGLPTLKDILAELAKPGRDPRDKFEAFSFAEGVNHIEDLRIGMKIPGIVTNVTNFGAFVDVGVHQDGLVHISQLADHYISNPADVVAVQQKVMVTVTEVDVARKRISLSMKGEAKPQAKKSAKPKRQREPETDMAAKLAALKGKFGR
ncbi:RNA-binding transcriptional accessory protein [Roseivirga spongicola]|uniref:RNA-binding transcriptional accessory protein n=1 Tax=Roseivirga spongicola TaxID=333140 RepID=A0A150X1K8_9BACT|nr:MULTISPECIES: Tex family protein [Roseivirga]KYG72576.1 RNA-binding transcriptional accessory protein [Roseivirga spongicola]MBO6659430.1 RNA-binding transcriptional accessory protein [Roseivirga sp.]MBO6907833.1 RNA-binding transcriptional accessory protein [Roseivirga sp.]